MYPRNSIGSSAGCASRIDSQYPAFVWWFAPAIISLAFGTFSRTIGNASINVSSRLYVPQCPIARMRRSGLPRFVKSGELGIDANEEKRRINIILSDFEKFLFLK